MPTPKTARSRGRPRRYVHDSNGDPVTGLRFDASTGQYYARPKNEKKAYFGSDADEAIRRFHAWEAHRQGRQVDLTRTVELAPDLYDWRSQLADPPKTREHLPVQVDEASFWEEVRRRLHADPAEFARKVGEMRIARLEDLQPIEDSLTPDEVWALYMSRKKKLTPEWQRKQKGFWDQFAKIVGKPKLSEITEDDVRRYHDAIWKQGERFSPTWRNHRLQFIGTILRAVIKQRRDVARLQRVLGFCDIFEFAAKRKVDPQPIERADLHAVLAVAPVKWKAATLLALNLALYPGEVAAVRKDELDLEKGTFVSRRSKTGVARVGVMWQRTIDAVCQYLSAKQHGRDVVLVNQNGDAYNANHISRNWRKLVEQAGCKGVSFDQLRDAAATAAAEGASSIDEVRMLCGHAVSGITDAYLRRRPQLVVQACKSIEKVYFK